MSGRHLVLVGLMGAGKTSVGEVCAQRLERPFVDTDELIETLTGASVPELFATIGEAGFRDRERDAIADACAAPAAQVIACGGGAVLDAENRRRLRETGFVVWLRGAPEVLAARVQRDTPVRPLLASQGAAPTLERLAVTRSAAYEAAAHTAVDTDDRTIDEVADAVLEAYQP